MATNPKFSFPHPVYVQHVLDPYLQDAKRYYYGPMLAANKAHVVMLHRQAIISRENAQALVNAIAQVEGEGLDALRYGSDVEDLFFAIENRLIDLAGPDHGGNLQLARSRNDLGYALTRLALRPALLDLIQATLAFRQSLADFADKHLDTLMPGYTHTQPAQPTTMAHYIAGIGSTLARDTQRLLSAYQVNNASPLGAAAFTGTGFPIDRALVADLLGFSSIIGSTYDAIAASDNFTDTAHVLTSLGINLSRFIKDLLFWATKESGAIRIHDSFIQISSIMPQKRNPVVLEHLRARISRMLGQAHTIVIQCHSIPFGDTQDIEDELLPSLFGGLGSAIEILALFKAVIETLDVNRDHLALRAEKSFISVTELADTLVRDHGLAFRQAHHIVSALVNRLVADVRLDTPVPAELLAKVSEGILGTPVELSQGELDKAMNPRLFIEKRTHLGGAAPAATRAVLKAQNQGLSEDQNWLQGEIERLGIIKADLQSAIEHI